MFQEDFLLLRDATALVITKVPMKETATESKIHANLKKKLEEILKYTENNMNEDEELFFQGLLN